MLVEQFLRLLITAVRTSKVGVLFLALAVLIVFALVVLGVASLVGDLLFMASARVPMIHFLGTGWGILAAAACAVVLALLGIGILWFLKSHVPHTEAPQTENLSLTSKSDEVEELRTKLHQVEQERDEANQEIERLRIELNNRPPRRFKTPVEVIETLTPAKAEEIEQLESKNKQLQEQLQRAALEVGLPPNVATERRIAHCDFHINDLLRLAGKGFIIEGKDFVHCTIRGPGVISTFEDVRPPEQKPKNTSAGSGYDPRTLIVKGEPELVLHEIQSDSDSVSGVIYLVGCTYQNVTFEGIGIAGSPEEIKFWRENAKFEGRDSVGMPGSEVRWDVVREEDSDG